MRFLAGAIFALALVALLSQRLQHYLRQRIACSPGLVLAAPAALFALFAAALLSQAAFSAAFGLLLAVYVTAPALIAWRQFVRKAPLGWADLAAVLLLWLPVEFALGKEFVPARAHGIANELAQGTATVLALVLLVICRGWPGAKYNLPRRWSDLWNPLAAFALLALPLAVLARALGFMGPFHVPPGLALAGLLRLFAVTLLGVAIPEELLFRSLIQNWLFAKLGESNRTLLVAAVVFGAAHLNNAPGPLPNWRYMLLATIAGYAYGKVFQRSTTVLSSAGLHALVNTVRHSFFA